MSLWLISLILVLTALFYPLLGINASFYLILHLFGTGERIYQLVYLISLNNFLCDDEAKHAQKHEAH